MKLKHIFWWVAGADRDRLEKCPSDQKRMGAIGMVILTTSFVAFVAGTAAAMFFTQKGDADSGKLGWSLAFGVLWMIIIFMIDRSLVVTMKKNPTRKHPNLALTGPFLFRMVLAAIIALMISIPLELFIFKDFIDNNRTDYDLLEQGRTKNNNERAMGKPEIEGERKKQETQLTRDSSDYQQVLGEISNLNSSIESKQSSLGKLTEENTNYRNQINTLMADSVRSHSIEITRIKGNINANNNNINRLTDEIEDLKRQIKSKKDGPLKDASERMNEARRRIGQYTSKIAEIDSVSDILQGSQRIIQKNSGHFFRDYQILSNMIDQTDEKTGKLLYPMELLFYWLIRIIFFLIELLPTLVKVITPVGAYDWLVYDEEKAMAEYFSSNEYHLKVQQRQDAKIQHEIDFLQKQNEIDDKLRLDILTSMSKAQMEVADEYTKKWIKEKLSLLKSESKSTIMENTSTADDHSQTDTAAEHDDFD